MTGRTTTAAGGFDGFPRDAVRYLQDLERHNNRVWFEQHREDYQRVILEPAQAFVVATGRLLRRLSSDIYAVPKINASIRRMNRDIRFSRDKRPYKNHLDLWFWQGSDAGAQHPGYFFRLTAKSLTLGAGMHMFDKPFLERYRDAVLDPRRGARLQQAMRKILTGGACELGGQHFKRPPRAIDPSDPRAPLLLHNGLFVGMTLRPVPAEVFSSAGPAFCFGHFRAMSPLPAWLGDVLVKD